MIELGPERLQHLNRLIGRPLCWKAFHIAGTNGKGTTAARLSSFLKAAGHRTGRFTSPHLIDRWDCIAINGVPIEENLFREAERIVQGRISHDKNAYRPSEFELLTATAFEVFNRQKVRYAVIECGMGGLLDATNVLQPKEVCASIITRIDYDHTRFLGNSLGEIAEHKAGIMKPGVPCFAFSDYSDEVNEKREVKSVECKMAEDEVDMVLDKKASELGADLHHISFRNEDLLHQELQIPLQNIALPANDAGARTVVLAYTAMKHALPSDDIPALPSSNLTAILRDMKWPGRFEQIKLSPWIQYDKEVLLDGAHNEGSAKLLAGHVHNKYRKENEEITWLLAFSEGKDIIAILRQLIQPKDNIVVTNFGPVDGMQWVKSANADDVKQAVLALRPPLQNVAAQQGPALHAILGDDSDASVAVYANENVSDISRGNVQLRRAIERAISMAKGTIVITGSLYLVGDIHRAIRSSYNDNGMQPPSIWV